MNGVGDAQRCLSETPAAAHAESLPVAVSIMAHRI
jgi:hypothetical protein